MKIREEQVHKCFVNIQKATQTEGAGLARWLCIQMPPLAVTYLVVKKMDSVVVEF